MLGQPSAAWGPLGHRAVGAVADALLTPDAQIEVARLLLDDRGRDGAPSGRTSLADVSLWADEIRGSEADRPRWHYDNMPFCRAITLESVWF
jgi:nuclease S1